MRLLCMFAFVCVLITSSFADARFGACRQARHQRIANRIGNRHGCGGGVSEQIASPKQANLMPVEPKITSPVQAPELGGCANGQCGVQSRGRLFGRR